MVKWGKANTNCLHYQIILQVSVKAHNPLFPKVLCDDFTDGICFI